MRKPNFFIVGAPRCGTTSMYTYLKQHPEIYVSIDKEPHFFGSDLSPMPGTIREEALYLELFAGAGDRPRVGEGSVWYLSSERAPREIRAFAPEARILVLLRDPVQMAHSLYSLYSRTGNEDLPTFEEALAAEPERRQGRRIPPRAYFPEGLLYTEAARYAGKVERYFEVFGRENVHCILFEDFTRDTAAVYRRTLEFLGVDPGFEAELDPRRASLRVRMQAIRQLRHAPAEVKRRMQFKEMKQHEGAAPRAALSAELSARLRDLFAEDIARLGALLGRDLGEWARPNGNGKPAQSGARLREVLESVRVLKKIPPEIRAKHERVETLERKFSRWQRVRVPDLPLQQRPYNDAWPSWFADERARIAGALGPPALLIEHFGSTSVPGLSSKNIIDIAVGLDGPPGRAELLGGLAGIGYENHGNSPIDPETLWLWRLEEERAFVIHLCGRGRPWMDEQMDLRDYLRAHPGERDRYADLKRRLAAEIDQSFLQYTISKMSMSIEMIDKAREWRAGSGPGEPRAVDDQALVGAGADDAGRGLDLDLEAEQPALRDLGQPDADRHLLARPGGADMGDVDAGADRGLPVVQQGLDEREAGVLGEADHPGGREDAVQVGRPHVGSHGVGGLVLQAGGELGAGHERE
jgi:GrpB-like predicted nucleotidyltransferase (UPF0157 family)